MKLIQSFDIQNHGIENCQYFSGCGTAYSQFNYCVTGIGESAKESFEDCLEQIAQNDFDTSKIEKSKEGKTYLTKRAQNHTVSKFLRKIGLKKKEIESENNENYYYLSIRWNE